MQTKAKIGQQIFFGILIAIIFNGLGMNNEGNMDDKIDPNDTPNVRQQKIFYATMQVYGGVFFALTNTFMGNLFNTVLIFQQERPVFLREQSNKMYRVAPYFFSKVIVDTPVLILGPLVFTLIIYFSMGLQKTADQFFSFFFTLSLLANAAASIGYFVSSIFENE
mmetsp:Transcript_111/g.217  ORF Transcript_111/g.217 Transcript_111/m.217 type:complete len:165 (+) Transcript_111:726-1220(+)